MDDYFSSGFRALTRDGERDGYEPLRWQRRLFEQFCQNDIPKVCALPTGLGKTSIIHLWLLALVYQIREKQQARLPTRLVYVVDRRTVVDQATTLAEAIKNNLTLLGLREDWLSVSTLRGQFADNREWMVDPSRPAIIIGTVDMIGSRLLFSGYRSGYKRRPLEAGLLARDALLILDEAHLSNPFAKLTRWIEGRNVNSLFVMHMSATSMNGASDAFTLLESDLKGDRDSNPIARRYKSDKRLTIHEGVTDLHSAMLKAAIEFAMDHSRVVVFVRSPDAATRLAAAIRKQKPFDTSVSVLTGTMRGWERDKLLEKPENKEQHERRVMQRFLEPTNRWEEGPAILVSTSAGEVGFDVNADHLVCDAAPLDSVIQRLGRVNRRGDRTAAVHLFGEKLKETKKQDREDPHAKRTFEAASAAAIEALKGLPKLRQDSSEVVYDASPQAFDRLAKPEDAFSPKPTTVELTDILLDAWSMTSITETIPGRPPVAAWLRGLEEDLPQTTLAWRAELELFSPGEVDLKSVDAILQKHRIRPHETLTARTDYVVDFLKKVVITQPCLSDTSAVLLSRELKLTTIVELINDPSPLRADPTLVLPASFGGLDTAGMLNDKFMVTKSSQESFGAPLSLDVADVPGYERRRADRARVRLLLERTEDGWSAKPMPGATLPESLSDLSNDLAASLLDTIKERLGMKLRLRQPLKANEEGNVTRYLLSFYPSRSRKLVSTQPLDEHVKAVEACAARIGQELQLGEPFLSALKLAAKYHDEGKKAEIWQHAVGNKDLLRPLGKSGGRMNGRQLGGYRHEFGTLLRITDAKQPAADLHCDAESLDLMLHLVAVHHGNGRPHFAKSDDINYCDRKRCPQVGTEVIQRFARLQRQYGYWRLAWLENLLRCADAMASAENEEEDT